ncbi:MAG: COG4280 domain-containing protein [Streptosporangiaceae bacterium]
MSTAFLLLAVFLACAVEAVEALTIVLAVGVTRGWRSTLTGVGGGLVVLAAIVGALGPALVLVPLNALRLVVGGLLLVFGLQWLRKAVLRAAGIKATHDEAAIYHRQLDAARGTAPAAGRLDWYAFTLAGKGVLLEGLEVAFIVLTFGANQGNIPVAVIGAAAAVVLVTGVGAAVRGPLTRMPENTLKYTVGVLLTGFGTFWGAEGAGAHWPGGDAAIPAIIAVTAATALVTTWLLRRGEVRRRAAAETAEPRAVTRP